MTVWYTELLSLVSCFVFLFFVFLLEKPQKIDVFEDYLYIKLYDQSIIKMNKFGNGNGTFLINGYRSSDIGILHPLKQNRNSKSICNAAPLPHSQVSFGIKAYHSKHNLT